MTQLTLWSPERWLPVPGYEQNYRVSDWGCVWSLPRATTRGGPLRFIRDRADYQHVTLTLHGKQKRFAVHRLVMLAFVGPCPPGMEVRHLDGDLNNNRLDNLAYGTHRENMLDRRRHGTDPNAAKTHCPDNHEYTPENTYRDGRGARACRTCARTSARERARANYVPVVHDLRDCGFCGTAFRPRRSDSHFCSRACITKDAWAKKKRQPERVVCAYCGEPFMTIWPWQRYCTRRCSRRDNGY